MAGIFIKLFEKQVSLSKFKRMRRYYTNLLLHKEKEIEQLKSDKQILLRNSIRQAEKNREIVENSKKVIEINKDLCGKFKSDNDFIQ